MPTVAGRRYIYVRVIRRMFSVRLRPLGTVIPEHCDGCIFHVRTPHHIHIIYAI